MYDRPDLNELLEAVQTHLEANIVPAVRADRRLYFQTLVAINVLKIAAREMDQRDDHAAAQWERLNALLGKDTPAPTRLSQLQSALAKRNTSLSAAIRAGDYDMTSKRTALFAHLKAAVTEQLMVANPRFLATLQAEDENPELDAWEGR